MAKTFDPGSYLVPGPFFQQLQRLLREEGIVDQVAIHWRKKRKNFSIFATIECWIPIGLKGMGALTNSSNMLNSDWIRSADNSWENHSAFESEPDGVEWKCV